MRKGKISDFIGIIFIIIAVFLVVLVLHRKTFNSAKFNVKNEFQNITELTSDKYQGRLAGSEGNLLAIKYVENYFKKIGIKPGGDKGTYYQNFKSIVPTHVSMPHFKIEDYKGRVIKEYVLGKDYIEYLEGYGGIGQAKSKMLYIKDWIRNYKRKELNGKIIIVDSLMGDNDIEYAINNGVEGILSQVISGLEKKSLYVENKPGKTVLIHLLPSKQFNEVVNYAEKGLIADIKLDEPFKMAETPNLLGKIEGRKKDSGYIIFSSHIDGFGMQPSGEIYPGAMDSASGTSIVLELARIIKNQKYQPDKTIIFALWNNEEYGIKGKQFYVENPIYTLNKSTVIYLNNLGGNGFTSYNIGYKGDASHILMNKMTQFSGSTLKIPPSTAIDPFVNGGAAAISIEEDMLSTDSYGNLIIRNTVGTMNDTIQTISKDQLSIETNFLLQYIKKEVYGDVLTGLLNTYEKIFLFVLGISLMLIYIINTLYKVYPQRTLMKISIEDVFYSIGFGIFKRFFYFLFQASLILISVVFITHIPFNFNLFSINGRIFTNFSWNQVLVESEKYIRMLFTTGFGKSSNGYNVMDVVNYSFSRSFKLLISVIIAAVILGISKGLFDTFRSEGKSTRRTIGTILLFSIPDVFVVVLIQMLFIYFYNHKIFINTSSDNEIKAFVISFLSLILLPSIYITRIASIAVHEELKRDYVKAARAKGLSNFLIAKNHLLISVFIKVIDALPSIINLIISNLIIVEYLSNYNGIISNMMLSYKNNDINSFTGLSLSLCFMCIFFIAVFKFISSLVNPLKRRQIR
jgi:ABC-type dipeptide/oligopeptide/nickel transport system permease component